MNEFAVSMAAGRCGDGSGARHGGDRPASAAAACSTESALCCLATGPLQTCKAPHPRPALSAERLGAPTPGPKGLQLVWTTVDEVRNSIEGWVAGNSIPGSQSNVTKPFLQQYWHRWGPADAFPLHVLHGLHHARYWQPASRMRSR